MTKKKKITIKKVNRSIIKITFLTIYDMIDSVLITVHVFDYFIFLTP